MRFKLIPLVFSLAAVLTLIVGCSSTKHVSKKELPETKLQKKYAELIDVPPSRITNKALYEFIDKWLNTKYKYGAQQNTGIDCSGFTQLLYDEVYKKKIARNSESQYKGSNHISSRSKLQEGDLVFFTTVKGKKVSHVGVYLQNDRFINATSKGVVISDMKLKYWDDRYVGGGIPQ